MKKLILFLSFSILVATVCNAQATTTNKKVAADTLSTTASAANDTITLKALPSDVTSIQATLTKLSGTISTSGTAILQESNDGVAWVATGMDTLTFANQTYNTIMWKFMDQAPSAHYRILFTMPSSTQSSVASATYCIRPKQTTYKLR
jgi:hypothetical protein